MEGKKWYGLMIPKKAAKINTKGKSVFESDDSDDNVEDHVRVKKEPSAIPKEKKKVPPESKHEEIDPTIYEYDSIYDEMKASEKQKTTQEKSKEPRYINLLLKAAEKRKKESERRVERKIQAERVKEGDAFKDKEAFVTSAYRKKMLEMEEEEERECRESALEEMMDSTKQKDLSGFYRHFLKQTVGEEKVPEFGERDAKIRDAIQKEQDYPASKQRSKSPSEHRSRTIHSSPDKVSHSDIRHKAERLNRRDSMNKSDTKESKHNTPCDLDKARHSESKSPSRRSKGRHRSYSSSDSEDMNIKSRHSEVKSSSYKSQGRQQSCSSSDSEGRDRSRHSKIKSSSHRSQGKQQSCSFSDSEGRNSKAGHSKRKSSSYRNNATQRSCSSSDSEGKRDSKSAHSKSKTSSHRSNERQQSYSSSDSEGRKNKHGVEKSHKRKLDLASHSSKYGHDEKQKCSHGVKNQEQKSHEGTISDHHTTTKQSSEKYGNGHSSNKTTDQRPSLEKDREEYKKDVRVPHKKERESSQTTSKLVSGNRGYNDNDNKNREEYSKHDFSYNHGEVKKRTDSKRRESSICTGYPETKRRKHDDNNNDDDDDDISRTSSDKDEAKVRSSLKGEEGKKAPENSKIDMVTKFAKRTVGKIFDDAQARYFKRRDTAKAIN